MAKLFDRGSKGSRMVVCVDMLGAGFDLPYLKIAALHGPVFCFHCLKAW